MKKSIVALLAASAVVALTGAGAVAITGDEMRVVVKSVATADSKLNVSVNKAKPGCDVLVKIIDDTYEGDDDYTGDKVAQTNVKIGSNRSGSSTAKVSQAGDFYAYAKTQFTKLACLSAADNVEDHDNFRVGKGVYVYDIEGDYGDVSDADADQNQWNYSISTQIYADTTDMPRAGVGVELWVNNMNGERMYKLKTATTNSLGEATFKGVWDEDLHSDDYFEIRVTRDKKFYDTFYEYEGVAYSYLFND